MYWYGFTLESATCTVYSLSTSSSAEKSYMQPEAAGSSVGPVLSEKISFPQGNLHFTISTVLVTSNLRYFADALYRWSAESCTARYNLLRTFCSGCAGTSRRSRRFTEDDLQIRREESAYLPGRIGWIAWKNQPICWEEAAKSPERIGRFIRTYILLIWIQSGSKQLCMQSLQHYIWLKYLKNHCAHVLAYIYVRTNVDHFRALIALPTFCGQGSDSLRTEHRYSADWAQMFHSKQCGNSESAAEFGGLA